MPFYLCALHIYHVTRVATLSVRILAYPKLSEEARSGVILLHLQRALPADYGREITKESCKSLDEAVEVVESLERADHIYGSEATAVSRVPAPVDARCQDTGAEKDGSLCFVCGQSGHWRRECLFWGDVCGQCGRRGHLGVMCRRSGNDGRSSGPRGARRTGAASQPRV